MPYTTLISPSELLPHLDDSEWAVVDCRFTLRDVERGRTAYRTSHIAGSVYAHLDEDLSGPIVPGRTGRHPLPEVDAFAATLSRWGIDESVQVVVYDDAGGAIAARLWWMLRWMGHQNAALLDGGWQAWEGEGSAVRGGSESRASRRFTPRVRTELLLAADDLAPMVNDTTVVLCDARSEDRYRGENETLDPVAGHIPGATSLPYAGNLDSSGRFLSRERLRARYEAHIGDVPVQEVVMYCGSGVTAAHNVLAAAHAGLGEALLYAGSWSDWITDPGRPVETG
jgi:thiosulfate/3-mercaptopyruvate sulfurtransferase